MQDEFDPGKTLKNLINSWWQIIALAIIGGLLGLGISYVLPPAYQAEAIFHASIDFTQINYDNMVGEYGDPLVWTQYEEDLALQAVERILLNRADKAFEYALTLDPELKRETFDEDQQISRYLANWFLRYRHEDPAIAQAIVNYWAEDGYNALIRAQQADRVESFVIVDLTSLAHLPETPIYHQRNTLVLAGTGVGFFIGILLVDFRDRFFSKRVKEA
jgi:hypothetical protein